MKGKPLMTEHERVIEALAKALELTYILSIGEAEHPTRKRTDPVPVKSENDFKDLYSKHWKDFKSKTKLATENQFKRVQKEKIQNLMNEITTVIPLFRSDERYLIAERYVNEYLLPHLPIAKANNLKEPEAMVKAWVIHFEMENYNKFNIANGIQISGIQAIDKYTDLFNWNGNKERIRQHLVKARSFQKYKFKPPTPKQVKDLEKAIKYMRSKEAISEAKAAYVKFSLL